MTNQINVKNANRQLYRSITLLNIDKFKRALANGAVIDDNRNKCTLNSAIITMMNLCPDKFDLIFIEDLINLGAKPCNEDNNNTLSVTVRNFFHEHNKQKECPFKSLYSTNKIKLIKLLIDSGALISNSLCEQNNTLLQSVIIEDIEVIKMIATLHPTPHSYILNRAIKTENLETIKIICSLGALLTEGYILRSSIEPNNDCRENTLNTAIRTGNLNIIKFVADNLEVKPNNQVTYGSYHGEENNTLNIAVSTKNIEIVKFVAYLDAKPYNFQSINNNNTLISALLTENLEILKEIILLDSRTHYSPWQKYGTLANKLPIFIFYDNFIKNGYDDNNQILINKLNKMLIMIMCVITSPVTQNEINNTLSIKNNTIFEEKIKTYCTITKGFTIDDQEEMEKIKILMRELKDTTQHLSESYQNKKNIILEIHDCIVSMSSCCIGIIFDYQSKTPLSNLIDWSCYDEIYR